jgi:hypothetical protein
VISAIICSGEFGTSKVGGGISDIFEVLVGIFGFPSVFRRFVLAKTDFGVEKRPYIQKDQAKLRCSTTSNGSFFRRKTTNQVLLCGLD